MCIRWGYTLSSALEEDLGLVMQTVTLLRLAGHQLGAIPVLQMQPSDPAPEDPDE